MRVHFCDQGRTAFFAFKQFVSTLENSIFFFLRLEIPEKFLKRVEVLAPSASSCFYRLFFVMAFVVSPVKFERLALLCIDKDFVCEDDGKVLQVFILGLLKSVVVVDVKRVRFKRPGLLILGAFFWDLDHDVVCSLLGPFAKKEGWQKSAPYFCRLKIQFRPEAFESDLNFDHLQQ